jgi:hypothetical protein
VRSWNGEADIFKGLHAYWAAMPSSHVQLTWPLATVDARCQCHFGQNVQQNLYGPPVYHLTRLGAQKCVFKVQRPE